ncbi:UvrD-helicase domain-containing protein [Pseudomonas sp. GM17]|uniref:UvrD-helicase domain-containing protein n=1 Tax=Pseudomonas sp. GM17 TaxID=1144323 RepID=UPI0002727757|nr:UvrD-helicase domain-containing protein [Pseudomonas sp. GM17]WIE47834.1 AAA family ATPase [Pseudomonas sp. GM17]
MKALIDVTPTAEQLALFSRNGPGVEVIRGAAGSGKTTTALLKLRSLAGFYLSRAKRLDKPEPVNVLVLTFNRTLRGYINELTQQQLHEEPLIHLHVSTFNAWARSLAVPGFTIMSIDDSMLVLRKLSGEMKMDPQFVAEEAAYVMGRFLPTNTNDYLTARREGRGIAPRMERPARQLLLDTVIGRYNEYKRLNRLVDWNDLAVQLSAEKVRKYSVIVVDETQDFSANEVRAVLNQRAEHATTTFVLDSAQRIYSRNFSWQEVDVTVTSGKSSTLQTNYRNTKQIAHFASTLLDGLAMDDNGTMPNYDSAISEGEKPIVLTGSYANQVRYAREYIQENVDLTRESVAFLHTKGWFRDLIPELDRYKLPWVSLTGSSEWPQGTENIALCTLHSCKGLEFDHIIMIGLDGSVVDVRAPDEGGEDYEPSARLRRLIAMGVGRARKSVILGFKKDDAPDIIRFFGDDLYQGVDV